MVDDASADQKIILMVIRGVGERREIVIDLHNPHSKMRIQRYVDPTTNACREFKGTISDAGDSAACVS
jgi:hypothetical protein